MFKWYKKYIEKRTKEQEQRAERQLDALRFRYHAFKNLLICNNDLLEQMTRKIGKNLLMVSHSRENVSSADRIIELREGCFTQVI